MDSLIGVASGDVRSQVHTGQPVNRNELGELPGLTLSGHRSRNRSVFPSGASSQCEMVTGRGFSSPNQPDKERTTTYRADSAPDSWSDAIHATIPANREVHLGNPGSLFCAVPLSNNAGKLWPSFSAAILGADHDHAISEPVDRPSGQCGHPPYGRVHHDRSQGSQAPGFGRNRPLLRKRNRGRFLGYRASDSGCGVLRPPCRRQ